MSKRTRQQQYKSNNVKEKREYKLDVLGFFQADAADIISSRTRASYVHRGGNIRSAGDEVETAVRSFFSRRLPLSYTIHHGHFVDKNLTLSGQTDFIIADHGRFPVLFRGQEGLEYLPYEGVYAYGEVKSSLENSHLEEFIAHSMHVRTKMHRAPVPPGYIDEISFDADDFASFTPWPERGDIYRLLFAVSSDKFDIDKALRHLCDADPRDAPNLICLLDRGVIMPGRAEIPSGAVLTTYLHPQKMRPPAAINEQDGWVFSEPNSDYREGATLFYAYSQLLEHLKNNVLLNTNYIDYIDKIVTLNTRFVHKL